MNAAGVPTGVCHGCGVFQGTPGTGTPHPGTGNRTTAAAPNTLFQVFQGIPILGNTKTSLTKPSWLCLRGEYNAIILEHLEHRTAPRRNSAVFCSRVPWNSPVQAASVEGMT